MLLHISYSCSFQENTQNLHKLKLSINGKTKTVMVPRLVDELDPVTIQCYTKSGKSVKINLGDFQGQSPIQSSSGTNRSASTIVHDNPLMNNLLGKSTSANADDFSKNFVNERSASLKLLLNKRLRRIYDRYAPIQGQMIQPSLISQVYPVHVNLDNPNETNEDNRSNEIGSDTNNTRPMNDEACVLIDSDSDVEIISEPDPCVVIDDDDSDDRPACSNQSETTNDTLPQTTEPADDPTDLASPSNVKDIVYHLLGVKTRVKNVPQQNEADTFDMECINVVEGGEISSDDDEDDDDIKDHADDEGGNGENDKKKQEQVSEKIKTTSTKIDNDRNGSSSKTDIAKVLDLTDEKLVENVVLHMETAVNDEKRSAEEHLYKSVDEFEASKLEKNSCVDEVKNVAKNDLTETVHFPTKANDEYRKDDLSKSVHENTVSISPQDNPVPIEDNELPPPGTGINNADTMLSACSRNPTVSDNHHCVNSRDKAVLVSDNPLVAYDYPRPPVPHAIIKVPEKEDDHPHALDCSFEEDFQVTVNADYEESTSDHLAMLKVYTQSDSERRMEVVNVTPAVPMSQVIQNRSQSTASNPNDEECLNPTAVKQISEYLDLEVEGFRENIPTEPLMAVCEEEDQNVCFTNSSQDERLVDEESSSLPSQAEVDDGDDNLPQIAEVVSLKDTETSSSSPQQKINNYFHPCFVKIPRVDIIDNHALYLLKNKQVKEPEKKCEVFDLEDEKSVTRSSYSRYSGPLSKRKVRDSDEPSEKPSKRRKLPSPDIVSDTPEENSGENDEHESNDTPSDVDKRIIRSTETASPSRTTRSSVSKSFTSVRRSPNGAQSPSTCISSMAYQSSSTDSDITQTQNSGTESPNTETDSPELPPVPTIKIRSTATVTPPSVVTRSSGRIPKLKKVFEQAVVPTKRKTLEALKSKTPEISKHKETENLKRKTPESKDAPIADTTSISPVSSLRGRGQPRKSTDSVASAVTRNSIKTLSSQRGRGNPHRSTNSVASPVTRNSIKTLSSQRGRGKPHRSNDSVASPVTRNSIKTLSSQRGRGKPHKSSYSVDHDSVDSPVTGNSFTALSSLRRKGRRHKSTEGEGSPETEGSNLVSFQRGRGRGRKTPESVNAPVTDASNKVLSLRGRGRGRGRGWGRGRGSAVSGKRARSDSGDQSVHSCQESASESNDLASTHSMTGSETTGPETELETPVPPVKLEIDNALSEDLVPQPISAVGNVYNNPTPVIIQTAAGPAMLLNLYPQNESNAITMATENVPGMPDTSLQQQQAFSQPLMNVNHRYMGTQNLMPPHMYGNLPMQTVANNSNVMQAVPQDNTQNNMMQISVNQQQNVPMQGFPMTYQMFPNPQLNPTAGIEHGNHANESNIPQTQMQVGTNFAVSTWAPNINVMNTSQGIMFTQMPQPMFMPGGSVGNSFMQPGMLSNQANASFQNQPMGLTPQNGVVQNQPMGLTSQNQHMIVHNGNPNFTFQNQQMAMLQQNNNEQNQQMSQPQNQPIRMPDSNNPSQKNQPTKMPAKDPLVKDKGKRKNAKTKKTDLKAKKVSNIKTAMFKDHGTKKRTQTKKTYPKVKKVSNIKTAMNRQQDTTGPQPMQYPAYVSEKSLSKDQSIIVPPTSSFAEQQRRHDQARKGKSAEVTPLEAEPTTANSSGKKKSEKFSQFKLSAKTCKSLREKLKSHRKKI